MKKNSGPNQHLYCLTLTLCFFIIVGIIIIIVGERGRQIIDQSNNPNSPQNETTQDTFSPPKNSLTRHVRNVAGTVDTANFTQCNQKDALRHISLTLCIPSDSSTTTLIPYTSLSNERNQKGGSWGNKYQWYMTLDFWFGKGDPNERHSYGKEMSGIDESRWDRWMSVFGNYKGLVTSTLVSIAVFAAVLTLCGCCCIPCLRSLGERLIGAAITSPTPTQQMALVDAKGEDNEEDLAGEDTFPTPPSAPSYGRWEMDTYTA